MSASTTTQPTTSSRSRTQSRKKVNDDAAYFGPPASSTSVSATKRQAPDKAEGEPRVKRKRVETHIVTPTNGRRDNMESEPRKSLVSGSFLDLVSRVSTRRLLQVEFQKMPTQILYRYLAQFDIVPGVYPSPLSPEDPPAPSSLVDSQHQESRPLSPPILTPANRPRRDPKDSQGRRRSSRLLEEDTRNRVPILADVDEVHNMLASIVSRHFKELTSINGREEVDTLAAFMCAVEKSKGGKSKIC